jgi:exonuclease VII small subunit
MTTVTNDVEKFEQKLQKITPIFQRAVKRILDKKLEEFHKIFNSSSYDYQTIDEELKVAKNKLSKLVDKRRKNKTKSKEVENLNSKTLVSEKKSEPFFRL